MSQVIFSSWGRQIVDNRQGGETDLASLKLKLPDRYLENGAIGAFMGWDGIIVLDRETDIVAMAAEYMKRVQEKYCCAKCSPGKKGTRVLQDTLARIVSGHGEERDLEIIEGLSALLDNCKCTLCMTSALPVFDTVKYFRDDYLAYIRGRRKAKPAASYHDKLTAPCMDRCPAHIDIPSYIEEIKNRRFDESLDVIRRNMPIPAVCGRVCPHPCESACRRALVDEPISIMVLKRVAADHEWMHHKRPPMAPAGSREKTVCVIGGGPAGVSCAYYLALEGYKVTILDMLPEPGGTVAVGIPDYRMPRDLLRREYEIVQGLGVEIKFNTKLGRDISLKQVKEQYDGVFIGVGAFRSKPMGVEGEDQGYEGFSEGGINYLRAVALGQPIKTGKRVIVVGGGNTAIDCVRVALREGAEDSILVYRRTRKEMPAESYEVDDAEEEGVQFEFLRNPTRLVHENGRITGVEVVKMELGEPDESGRRRPQPVPGSEYVIPCDMVIPAIGQDPDLSFLEEDNLGIETTRWNTIVTRGGVLMTDCKGVFAGGDCEIGPMTVVAAVGQGRRAARAMARYLETGRTFLDEADAMEDLVNNLGVFDKDEPVGLAGGTHREHQPKISGPERARGWDEIELAMPETQAVREAERCLRCYRVGMVAVG
ncbi:dihydropyrimidine dehydrogenase subunit A [Geothermobacter hydrogeniphilus]|uniref:NADPH-Fe(3+) oxidoreductase subunit beta n=1 Tax=Geothermobacter hydrogeniphilus TaxID=1969733 RepID=A0A2K2HEI7_9BACT|nr:FAD-dependent oxidoreductase [Geothermobacter hydrogeniphilus]PNU21712.1 dihydropyrimidine dehydrogenase subunit A [Geothermobacter hydrogeniphilus]